MIDSQPDSSPPSPREMLPWKDKYRFQRQFREQASRSYVFLCFGIGLIAFLLPIALVVSGGYEQHFSISYFYHVSDPSRNILVGGLCAIGMFLFLFHGLSSLENQLLNLAGIAAISVAMNPMGPVQCQESGVTLHYASALVLFACLGVVAIFLAKGRVRYIIYPPMRSRFIRAYTAFGLAMVIAPAAVLAIHFLSKGQCESHTVFWVECAGIWSFAAYWFTKTYEYRVLLRIR